MAIFNKLCFGLGIFYPGPWASPDLGVFSIILEYSLVQNRRSYIQISNNKNGNINNKHLMIAYLVSLRDIDVLSYLILVWVFPGGSVDKESTCNAEDCLPCRRPGFNPWVRMIPWRSKQQPTPVFLPRNPMDRGAWWATGPWSHKSRTQLIS